MQAQPTTLETAQKLGLIPEEYEAIKTILGRIPNFTELSIYSVMWSEHCSYKNSIKLLKTLPKEGSRLLAKAGEENAGLIDVGDDIAVAFKIESHNHPSAIEPYQGAATGVGGINRDIFTMGARPIAQLNSLRFGNPLLPKTQWIVRGVVKGIGDYGNSFGVPTVGGEVFFDECFNQNPLVNALSVGIVPKGKTVSAIAYGDGNPVFIVGSATGKDGIHGATFASGDLNKDSAKDLPSVQVGDPFQEKLLLEATLEVIETGAVIGMQDMGAAGITCSTSEMSAKGKSGMKIDLDKVPTRQKDMKAYEILLSESQERMLIVGKKGMEQEIVRVFEKWDLNCVQIGEVIPENNLIFIQNNEIVAEVNPDSLVLGGGAPQYSRTSKEPAYLQEIKKYDINNIPQPKSIKDAMLHLAAHPNIASKNWVTQQYDGTIGTLNMCTNKPSAASIVNLKGTERALALTIDCNSRYVYAQPNIGTQIAVCEAARNIACSGGEALAISNCLNFGNPHNPEVYWQFEQAIQGMSTACLALDTPVTGGNVSFYNQSTMPDGSVVPVYPSPVIAMLGILNDKTTHRGIAFEQVGDLIYLLGKNPSDLACSQYVYSYHNQKFSPAPYFNLEEELLLHQNLHRISAAKIAVSMNDVSDGGLFVCLLQMAMPNNLGVNVQDLGADRLDAFLFGEAQGRAIVCIKPEQKAEFEAMLNVPFALLGNVSTSNFVVNGVNYGEISDFAKPYHGSLPAILD